MSTRLSLRVLATLPLPSGKEVVASEKLLSVFSPDVLDAELESLLASAIASLRHDGVADLKECRLEVAIHLFSDEAGLRPALHLSQVVIDRLAAVGASLDFDPYC